VSCAQAWNLRFLVNDYAGRLDLHAVPKDRVKVLGDGSRE
jgi:hypothetical protein